MKSNPERILEKPELFKSKIAPDVAVVSLLNPDELADPEIIEMMGMLGRIPIPRGYTPSEKLYAIEEAITHPGANLTPLLASLGRRFSEVAITGVTLAGAIAQNSWTSHI